MADDYETPADIGTPSRVPRHSHGYTDFAAHSHAELYAMLYASDPASIREAAAAWQSTGRMLADQAEQLRRKLVGFSQMWQGQAADEYNVMITDLARGLAKVGDGALAMNDLMTSSAESVETARSQMPPPSAVPDLDPQVMATATAAPAPEVVMNPAASAQFQQNQLQAQQAVQAHQAQVAATQAAQARAVQVMQTLATSYGGDEDRVPATPESVASGPAGAPASADGAVPVTAMSVTGVSSLPTIDPSGAYQAGSAIGSDGLIGSGTAPSASVPASPLFGHMFTAGLAAASAAATGRFGAVMPRLPSFLNPQSKKAQQTSAAAAAAARVAAAQSAARVRSGLAGGGGLGAGGLGGGALGAGGLGGIGGGGVGGPGDLGAAGTGPSPSAYPGLIGGGGSAGAAAGSLAGPAAGAGATGASGTSGMPMMPMGAMGAGAGGDLGGRRIPPWLVETEDVWGESSAVAPPVIGEDL